MQPECEIVAQQQNSLAGLCQRRNSAAGSKRGWRSVKIRPGFPDRFPLSSLPEIFSPDGPLARAIGGYRVRQQQVEMAERIAAAIHSNSVFIAEAGTGTGKTFAYLVPALQSNGKVIVSTGTKTLQDQLFNKDLPMVRDILKAPVKIACMRTGALRSTGN